MLPVLVKGKEVELWDEKKEEFVYLPAQKDITLKLEHSLISISKWESKWNVPFIETKKTDEQALDYIKCMTLNQDVPDSVYERLTKQNIKDISDYIQAPMTATKINVPDTKKINNEFITSELVYYWMIMYGIPEAFEKWHFNRLITLIRVCSEKSKPEKKKSQSEIAAEYQRINERNKAKFHTRG